MLKFMLIFRQLVAPMQLISTFELKKQGQLSKSYKETILILQNDKMFKITITEVSRGKALIIDILICHTRKEAEEFIESHSAQPQQYRPTKGIFYQNQLI